MEIRYLLHQNFAEVYYIWEKSATSIDSRTNALKGYLTGVQIWEVRQEWEQEFHVTYTVEQRITVSSCTEKERGKLEDCEITDFYVKSERLS